MKEKAILFGKFKTLIGVVSEPEPGAPAGRAAVVLSNAGLIHRIGPNRVYVKLARQLAAQGHRVLRFDLSGVGDSQPRPDHLPVEEFTIDDVKQAMDYLAAAYGDEQFLLMGHCAGAYHSFRTAAVDGRVQGVVMMNPDGGETEWIEYDRKRKLARYYSNYYSQKSLFSKETWQRITGGQISYRNVIKNVAQNMIWNRLTGLFFKLKQQIKQRLAPPPPAATDEKLFTMEAILRRCQAMDGIRVLLIYSEGATSLERIQISMKSALKQLSAAGKLQVQVIRGADHIFSPLESQTDLIAVIKNWTAARS